MSWMKQQGVKEALEAQGIIKMAYQKPKISYSTIRKNTSLDRFTSKKTIEEDEEEVKEGS